MDRVAEQPDRAGQYRHQKLGNARDGQADRADRDSPVGLLAFLHVIPRGRQRKRGGWVTHACGLMHLAMAAAVIRASNIAQRAAAALPADLICGTLWWHI